MEVQTKRGEGFVQRRRRRAQLHLRRRRVWRRERTPIEGARLEWLSLALVHARAREHRAGPYTLSQLRCGERVVAARDHVRLVAAERENS
jgi:hypothetical protein